MLSVKCFSATPPPETGGGPDGHDHRQGQPRVDAHPNYTLIVFSRLGEFLDMLQLLCTIVLLPENLHAYFELSVQAWILYKAPQWNARYPNSCPERIKLKMH